MSLQKDSKQPRFQVDRIFFSLDLFKAHIPIKFKSRFFVEIKTFSTTSNLKILVKSKDHYRTINSLIQFDNEKLQFDSYLVYDNKISSYKKKQIQIIVNLISDNRGDQTKLVGRLKIDLADFMIQNMAETIHKQQELQNCSVKKPQVAKIQYELSLVRQDKLKIQSSPDKDSIFAQIQKSQFTDPSQYNQFLKQVYGSDQSVSSLLNSSGVVSKVNKSLVENGNSNKAISKNGPELKPSSKQKQHKQSSLQKHKNIFPDQQSILKNEKKHSQKKVSIQIEVPSDQTEKQKPKSPKKVISPRQVQSSIKRQSPPKRSMLNSSTKSIPKSSQISMVERQSVPIEGGNKQTEIERQRQQNYLTQSMYDQQQLMIESLQEQLQQANQIIQQYKLEFDLLKQQNQKLFLQREAHLLQQQIKQRQTQRSNKQKQLTPKQQTQPKQQALQLKQSVKQIQNLKKQIQQLQETIKEYKKVFIQKQDIIQYKSQLIQNFQSDFQAANLLFQEKLIQKDQINQNLTIHLQNLNQTAKNLQTKLKSSQEQNQYLTTSIEQLKNAIDGLEKQIKNSNTAQLYLKLSKKDDQIKQLTQTIQLQRVNCSEHQLKSVDLQNQLQQAHLKIQILNKQVSLKQNSMQKYHSLKQKAEQQMNKAVQKSKAIEKQKYFLTQQINTLNMENKSVSKQVQQKVISYKNQLSQMEQSYQQAQNKNAQLKFAVQSYQSTLQQEQQKNMQQVAQLTRKLQNFNKKQHLLRQSLDMLQNETNKIRVYVRQKQNKIKQYEDLLVQKEDQLSKTTDKMNFYERKYKLAESTVQELKLELRINQAMAPSEERLQQNGQNDQEQLQKRIFILNQANSQMLQKQKQQTKNLILKDQTIHELEKQLNSIDPLKRQIISLQQKVNFLESKNTQLRQQLKILNKEVVELKSNLQKTNSQLEHAYSECQKFQEEIKALQEQKFVVHAQDADKQIQINRLQNIQSRLKEQIKMFQRQKTQVQHIITHHAVNTTNLLEKIQKLESQKHQLQDKMFETNNRSEKSSPKFLKLDSEIKVKKQDHQLRAKQQQRRQERSSSHYSKRSKQQEQVYGLRQQLEAYKQREQGYMCDVLNLQMQLDKIKQEKLSLSTSMNEQKSSMARNKSLKIMSQPQKKQLKAACDQLQKLIENRIKNKQTQSILQMLISNSEILAANSQSRITTEQGSLLAKQKNNLQQKSRILSRQMQKIKSLILKKSQISIKDKSELIQILKPCENVTNQLIKIVQNFARQNDQENMSQA